MSEFRCLNPDFQKKTEEIYFRVFEFRQDGPKLVHMSRLHFANALFRMFHLHFANFHRIMIYQARLAQHTPHK